MAIITEKELKQHIKTGEFFNAYLIYGEENYLKQFYVNKIAHKAITKGFETFNLHTFEGKDTSISEIYEVAQGLPVMGGYSCVLVHDLDLALLPQGEFSKLKELLQDLPESCIIIFWMDSIEVNLRKNKKWYSVTKLFGNNSAVLDIEKRKSADIIKLLSQGASKRGCSIDNSTSKYMLTVVGDDLNIVLNELEKVCAYVGTGEITVDAINAVAVKTIDAAVFDLVRALVSNNSERSFNLLEVLFKQKIEPILILGAIISSYVDMYRVKVALNSGGRPGDISKIFNYRNMEFRLNNASRNAANLSIEQLRRCLNELCSADEQLKGSSIDKRIVLEQAMIKLLLISNGE